MIQLSDLIMEDNVFDLVSSKKDNVLKEMIYSLTDVEQIRDINEFYKAVLEREKIMSTGIGQGIAIPHVKIPQVSDLFMVIGRKADGLDFDSLDGKPVYLVLMVGAPAKQRKELLKVLAKIALTFKNQDFREKLFKASSCAEVYKLLREK